MNLISLNLIKFPIQLKASPSFHFLKTSKRQIIAFSYSYKEADWTNALFPRKIHTVKSRGTRKRTVT